MASAEELFQLYHEEQGGGTPADLESLADQIGSSKGQFDDLEAELDRKEQVILDAVEGDLEVPLESANDGVKQRGRELRKAALVAAGAVRLFADAMRTYNGEVKRIRSEYEAERWSTLEGDPMAWQDNLVARLQKEQRQLKELHVDGAADESAALLKLAEQGDVDEAIRNLLMAVPASGMGPPSGLSIRYLDAAELTFDPSLFRDLVGRLPQDDLVKLLGDPSLDLGIRDLILTKRDYDVVPAFAEQWKLSEVEAMGSPNCEYGESIIVGPDGRTYYVTPPATPDGEPTLEPRNGPGAYDGVKDDGDGTGWTTVDEDIGHAAFGEPMDTLDMRIAGLLSMGAAQPVGEWQSVGDEQDAFVSSQDGVLYVNDGTQPTPDYENAPSGPVPDSSGGSRSESVDRAQGRLDLITGALEGLANVDQMEANRHYATQVVFQEHDDGTRRAVITLNQVQTDGQGNVRVHQEPAGMNSDGSVTRIDR